MPSCSFATFSEASAFAKQVAKEHKIVVHILRRNDQFVVEGDFPAVPPTSKLQDPSRPPQHSNVLHQKQEVAINNRPSFEDPFLDDDLLCINCGEPISLERIRAIPSVTRCAQCQHYTEIFEGIDDREMLAEMLTCNSFLSENEILTINKIRDRLKKEAGSTSLRKEEITLVRRIYEFFLLRRAPIIFGAGGPGLEKRSSRWFDKEKLKDSVVEPGQETIDSDK